MCIYIYIYINLYIYINIYKFYKYDYIPTKDKLLLKECNKFGKNNHRKRI